MRHAPASVATVPARFLVHRLSIVLATVGCVVLLVGSASAGPQAQQQQPVPRRITAEDSEKALKALRQKAENGDAEAQFNLGYMYANARLVQQDNARAAAWYRKAADQGHANAQNSLAEAYATGRGVPRDDAQAVAWYRAAAERGHPNAQFRLGVVVSRQVVEIESRPFLSS